MNERMRRSALFVDLDNIMIGLKKLDQRAAELFGNDPSRWVDAIASNSGGEYTRRFLMKFVYLNPESFGSYRAFFTRSGFRVVDCPALTTQGKNSADIYMVIDILDALNGAERYDEFVIASADADFTPVLHRLRARDRQTTIITAGLSSASLRAVADSVIQPDQLAAMILGEDLETDEESVPSLDTQPSSEVVRAAAKAARESDGSDLDRVVTAITAAVRVAPKPLVSAAAAHAALTVDKNLKATDWRGAGSFRAFLALYVPEVIYAGVPSPGYVYDPLRHTAADLPADGIAGVELSDLQWQVCRLTDAPAMDSDHYLAVYHALSADLLEVPFNMTRTSKNVRDRTARMERAVGRNAINFVIRGLIAQGVIGGSVADVGPERMAVATGENVLGLCRGLRMNLNAEQELEIWNWIAVVESSPASEGSEI